MHGLQDSGACVAADRQQRGTKVAGWCVSAEKPYRWPMLPTWGTPYDCSSTTLRPAYMRAREQKW